MSKRTVSGITLTLLLIGMLILTFNIQPVKAIETIYIRADGSVNPDTASISTVDNITYVFTGNINASTVVERDNIVVDGAGYILQGTGIGYGFSLFSINNVTIKNINIRNFYYGFYLNSTSHNVLSGNNITANNESGILLDKSSDNVISGNNITNNWRSIILGVSSNYNAIHGNNITNNVAGIELSESSNNIISGNNITKNGHGIELDMASNYNTISGNNITANGNWGIILVGSSNNAISGNTITNNWYGIYLFFSSNNAISGNNITENYNNGILSPWHSNYNAIHGNNIAANNNDGISLYLSSNNIISGNNITNNTDGIELEGGSNTISGNNITNNGCGIYLRSSSSDNRFYHNNLINNTQQIYDYSWDHPDYPPSVNTWDDGYPSGGNYWSVYNGTDLHSGLHQNETGTDGIGDTPYTIDDDNQDNYPLMQPYHGTVRNLNTGSSYPSIQEALKNAEGGDRIFVLSGTYYEYLIVNRSLTLIGESRGTTFLDGNGAGTILDISADNVTVCGFTVQNGFNGISFESTCNCTIANNTITSNEGYGINGYGSHITIADNIITRNAQGINGTLTDSQVCNNTFFHNNFYVASYQGYLSNSFNNTWDNGCEGNYWSNYNGTDLDSDGIGDTELPWEGVDYYPLMNPYWNPADVDHDLDVDLFDAVRLLSAYGFKEGDENYNCHCDINEPYGVINLYDAVLLLVNYGKKYS